MYSESAAAAAVLLTLTVCDCVCLRMLVCMCSVTVTVTVTVFDVNLSDYLSLCMSVCLYVCYHLLACSYFDLSVRASEAQDQAQTGHHQQGRLRPTVCARAGIFHHHGMYI